MLPFQFVNFLFKEVDWPIFRLLRQFNNVSVLVAIIQLWIPLVSLETKLQIMFWGYWGKYRFQVQSFLLKMGEKGRVLSV